MNKFKRFIFGKDEYLGGEHIAHEPGVVKRAIRWFGVKKQKEVRRARLSRLLMENLDELGEELIKPMKIRHPWADLDNNE